MLRKLVLVVCITIVLSGCGQVIKYQLDEKNITVMTKTTSPLSIQVAEFSDKRALEEREKSERKAKGDSDLNDYTYDREFRGEVSEGITKMIVEHLSYSKVFEKAALAPFTSAEVTDEKLNSLNRAGVNAVMVGEIDHFYAYYDLNIGRSILYGVPLAIASGLILNYSFSSGYTQYTVYWYGPGLVLGSYLESLHPRRIERDVGLKAELVSTSTHETLWEGSFEISLSEHKSMPNISGGKKFQLVLHCFRDTVNEMVESISEASYTTQRE